MSDEINLDSAAMVGAIECGWVQSVRSVRSGARRLKGEPSERRRCREMACWLSFLRVGSGRMGAVFGVGWGVVCIALMAECYGDTGMTDGMTDGMTESGGARAEGCESGSFEAIPMAASSAESGWSPGVEGSLLGKPAQPSDSKWRDAGVHRRWQPWQLRFGLREAWCFVPPPRARGVSCLTTHGCEDAHSGGDEWAKRVNASEIFKLQGVPEMAGGELSAHAFAEDGSRVAASHCTPRDFCSALATVVEPGRGLGSVAAGGSVEGACGASYQVCSQRVSDSGLVTCRMPSATQLVQYFGEALGESPNWQGSEVAVFQRTDCLQWGVSWRRGVVEVLPRGVGLRWLANDDFGLSELREFFEAPFFEAAETERFYRWFSEGGWHQQPLSGGVMLRMGVLRGRRATLVEISWRRGEEALVP